MAHTQRQRFTPDEWLAIYSSWGLSFDIKLRRLRGRERRNRMTQEYADALAKLIDFQENQQDHVCGRTGLEPGDNLFAWAYDQLDYTEGYDPELATNSGYQLAKTALKHAAENRRPQAYDQYQQLFA